MKIQQTLSFKARFKKLHKNQIAQVESAIQKIVENPDVGIKKKGDLSDVYVYKFHLDKTLQLLAYTWEEEIETITLLQLGSHENFYRNLK